MASANNCEAIKLTGFQITIMKFIICTYSIHYNLSYTISHKKPKVGP